MNETELRELDAWIAEHVMGHIKTNNPDGFTPTAETRVWHRLQTQKQSDTVFVGRAYRVSHMEIECYDRTWTTFQPTIDHADAMEVIKKCAVKTRGALKIFAGENDGWLVQGMDADLNVIEAEDETLELAICLLAKKLFDK